MGVYYPQGIMTIRLVLEDFGDKSNAKLQDMHVFSVVCRNLRVQLNSYQEADTFDAEIDFKNFPFDPRTIRSAGVTIHVEDRKKLFRTNNSLNLLQPSADSIIFQGFADSDKISLDEERRTVTLEGRDFTSLLIDREYIAEPINMSKPLDEVLRELLDQVPETAINSDRPNEGIAIDNQTGTDLPILASLTDSKAAKAGAKNSRKARSYWDKIQEFVADSGLIAFISLDKLVITKPRKLYDRSKAKIFIYGKNLRSLQFERKLGRQKGFNVRVVSLNTKTKDLLEAKIPEEATEEWAKDIGIKREPITLPRINSEGEKIADEAAPFITFRLSDITDKDHLVSVGEKIFEEVGRQQIEGMLSTKEMEVADNENNCFNATQFRIGTPVEITIDQGDMEGLPKLLQIGNPVTRKNKIKQFLIRNCYDAKIAEALSESLTKINTPFFTKSVEFKLDQDNGWSMDLDFINFIDLPRGLVS